jgi:hypothetical protein
MMSVLNQKNCGKLIPPCFLQKRLLTICMRNVMPITIGMPPTRPSCLHNSILWILCYNGMCTPWDTKHRYEISSSLPFMLSTRVIGAPFLTSFKDNYINFGRGCIYELLMAPKPRDYPSHSSSPTYFGRRALEALRRMCPSLITYSLVGSNGIRATCICHRNAGYGQLVQRESPLVQS